MSYNELLEETKILAGVLRHKLGVKKGDRVVIYVSSVEESRDPDVR
jgi:propionyl-CoA synthetase